MANSAIIRTIRLEPVGGPPADRIIASSDRVTVIGRQSGCDAVLPDQSVSRRHASIAYMGGSWILTDMGSKHGSYLNGVHVPPGESAPLNDADVIRLGPFSFRIGGPNTAARMLTTQADAEQARALDVAAGSALLMVSRRTVSQGAVASVARLYHPGTRYRLLGHFSV